MIIKIKIFLSLTILTFGFIFFFRGYESIIIIDKNKFIENKNIDTNINKIPIKESNNSKKINVKEITSNNMINYNESFVVVEKNQTFVNIINKYFISQQLIYDIIEAIEKKYNLRYLKVGQKIYFYKNLENKKIEKIKMPIEKNVNLLIFIKKNIEVEEILLETKVENHSKEYIITSSLYSDGKKNNIPLQILSDLIRLYSFDLDFQRDIKKNTKVSISYETFNIEDREKDFFGDINYALIEIEKNKLEYFKFNTDDGFVDYFNRKGENVKKALLKTPLDGAKLSSAFGMRKHPISGFNKMHKGVDFAAPKGTPIYAGGNGTIEFVGRNGGYGNYIRIRHNNEYKTAYAHLSKFKKGIHNGTRVNQGDVIGYVGNTGNSTGPHLHYEIIYQNKHINPLKLKLPSGKKLEKKELERFKKEIKVVYANHLNLLFE